MHDVTFEMLVMFLAWLLGTIALLSVALMLWY